MPHLLAIDQGTTSSRAILFNERGASEAVAQNEFRQIYPANGWVEHDPEEIWQTTLESCRNVLEQAGTVAGIGITNQRETTIVWNRATGKPVYNAIVWQDRRTAEFCKTLKDAGHEPDVSVRTGLLLDPYFSATKIAWILDNVKDARKQAERGELAFGTVDCFLLWRLTGGKVHATDATNASRTLLYNIHEGRWDEALLKLFNIPASLLPEVKDCAADYGMTAAGIFENPLPIRALIGDQQAATVGQACFAPGMVKSTYGTGCFVMLNTGAKPVASQHRLLTTLAYRLGGKSTYALEGSIFMAGAAVQWLRDGIRIIESSSETGKLAASLESNKGVYLVPAFTGLGAPHWDPQARAAIFGMTRDTGRAELARATLEAVCYQTRDLLDAMIADSGTIKELRVDGGMVANDWLMQFLCDVLDTTVTRPVIHETTALGAAYLAGLQAGIYHSLDDIATRWQQETRFVPHMDTTTRQSLLSDWQKAVACTRTFTR